LKQRRGKYKKTKTERWSACPDFTYNTIYSIWCSIIIFGILYTFRLPCCWHWSLFVSQCWLYIRLWYFSGNV